MKNMTWKEQRTAKEAAARRRESFETVAGGLALISWIVGLLLMASR